MTTVAVCQAPLAIGDIDGNRAALRKTVNEAASAGARIIVVPELANSGYLFANAEEARSLAEPLDGTLVTAWAEDARRNHAVIAAGFCELGHDGQLFNSAVLVDGSGVRAHYRKTHLWDREKLIFTPGHAPPPVVTTNHGRIGLMICYDLQFPEWVRLPALQAADLLCIPTNWPREPRPEGERPVEIVRAQASASVNRMFIAVADRVRPERGVEWVGGSVIIDPRGWPIGGPRPEHDAGVILADCQLGQARDKSVSKRNDVHADRRQHLYSGLLSPAKGITGGIENPR